MLFPAKSDESVSTGLTSAAMTTPGSDLQDRAYFGYGGVSPRDNDENDEDGGGKKNGKDGKKKKKAANGGLTTA